METLQVLGGLRHGKRSPYSDPVIIDFEPMRSGEHEATTRDIHRCFVVARRQRIVEDL